MHGHMSVESFWCFLMQLQQIFGRKLHKIQVRASYLRPMFQPNNSLTPVSLLTDITIAFYFEASISVSVYKKWNTVRTQYTSQYRNDAGRQ